MKSLTQLLDRFSKLSPRERLLSVLAVCAVVYFIVDSQLLAPQRKTLAAIEAQKNQQTQEKTTLEKSAAELSQVDAATAAQQAMVADYKRQIAAVDAFLAQPKADVPQAGVLIRDTLAKQSGLSLVGLKTLPSSVFYTPPPPPQGQSTDNKPAAPALPPIYKHGIELSVKGSYPALVTYLEHMQHSPLRVFWSEAKLDTATYPESVLRVVIYTLSHEATSPLR